MTHKDPIEETPFNLTYGTEVISLLEVALSSPRVDNVDLNTNEEWLRGNFDLLKEAREAAQVQMSTYQRWVAQYYNSRVKTKLF